MNKLVNFLIIAIVLFIGLPVIEGDLTKNIIMYDLQIIGLITVVQLIYNIIMKITGTRDITIKSIFSESIFFGILIVLGKHLYDDISVQESTDGSIKERLTRIFFMIVPTAAIIVSKCLLSP